MRPVGEITTVHFPVFRDPPQREILPSGKSRAFVNDSPVNLSALQELGERLIDIHSQHQNLQLVDDSYQFQVIDALANNKKHLNDYMESYSTL